MPVTRWHAEYAWLGGEEGPDATARILFGRTEPSGRLPVTFPRHLEDTPAHAWYPGGADAVYGEGLHVGYRHFDAAAVAPMFPFGFGLTYTRFAYGDLDAPETVRAGDTIDEKRGRSASPSTRRSLASDNRCET